MNAPIAELTKETETKNNHPKAQTQPLETCYGYARIYPNDRNEVEQVEALRQVGVPDSHIFIDFKHHGNGIPAEYSDMVHQMRPGDTLIISSLDRLGSSYEEIIAQCQLLTRVKRAYLVVLDLPLMDMRNKRYEPTDRFLGELLLQFLAYASKRERESTRIRQREGILAAKERGVRFGRPPKPIPPEFDSLLAQWNKREISSRQAAKQLGVAQETFLRWARKNQA